jgi:hypothetical protein
MLAFGRFAQPNELRKRGYYAIWCYLPRVNKKTVHHWRQSTSIADRVARLSRGGSNGQAWAVINGAYFDYNASHQVRQALIGSVGNGRIGRWSHGAPPARGAKRFQRWAFGFSERFSGQNDFSIALMQREGKEQKRRVKGFVTPTSLEARYPYGFSGLLCLIRNGQAQVWRDGLGNIQLSPPHQWNGSTEFRDGYYRRAAIGWTQDGRHLFMVVHHHPRSVLETRDLFAQYRGSKYLGRGELVSRLRKEWEKLPSHQRPCLKSDLPSRIENALLLDGGHSATLMLRRQTGTRSDGTPRFTDEGSWVTGRMQRPDQPPVPSTFEVVESP